MHCCSVHRPKKLIVTGLLRHLTKFCFKTDLCLIVLLKTLNDPFNFAQSVKLSSTTILQSLLPFHKKYVNFLYCARSSDTGTHGKCGTIIQRMLTVLHNLPQALTTCLQYANKLNNHMLNHKMLVTLC